MPETSPWGLAISLPTPLGDIQNEFVEQTIGNNIGNLDRPKGITQHRRLLTSETKAFNLRASIQDMLHDMKMRIVGQNHLYK